jgi:glycosyltransferase involved in cell wall biosynthesis
LITSTSEVRGGAEEYSLKLARRAVQQGWDVHCLLRIGPGTRSLCADLLKVGATCHRGNAEDRVTRRATLHQCLMVLVTLVKIRPALVLVNIHAPDKGFGALLACRLVKVPTIVVFHSFIRPLHYSSRRLKAYHWLKRGGQAWVAVSEDSKRYICGSFQLGNDEVHVIHNGATVPESTPEEITTLRREVRRELGLPDNEYLILTIARLSELKGYLDLIPVIKQLSLTNERLRFVWVGEGTLRERLEQEIEKYEIANMVILLGHRDDVYRILKAADLFVFPSRGEGLSYALIEAMACALPIICSNVNSAPELVQQDVHAKLFLPGDCFKILEGIRWAMMNPELAQEMARNAKRRSVAFSEDAWALATLELMQKESYRTPQQPSNQTTRG